MAGEKPKVLFSFLFLFLFMGYSQERSDVETVVVEKSRSEDLWKNLKRFQVLDMKTY